MPMINLYSKVRLNTDKYREEGAELGMIGFVIESYKDGNYEVEFSDEKGVTISQLVLSEEEVDVIGE